MTLHCQVKLNRFDLSSRGFRLPKVSASNFDYYERQKPCCRLHNSSYMLKSSVILTSLPSLLHKSKSLTTLLQCSYNLWLCALKDWLAVWVVLKLVLCFLKSFFINMLLYFLKTKFRTVSTVWANVALAGFGLLSNTISHLIQRRWRTSRQLCSVLEVRAISFTQISCLVKCWLEWNWNSSGSGLQ